MMGGGGRCRDDDDDWVLPCPGLADVTLVLVGKVGSGKSATANSILGCEAFPSRCSYNSVTQTCQMRSKTFHDGCVARTVSVIDTPGLFDMDITAEYVRKEIVKCMDMAKDGIHAMLMVFSATSRFSREDEKTVESIKLFFGEKILDHIILVFTRGDDVGGEISWKEMLAASAPVYLQDMLMICTNRVLLFDNKTSNMHHRDAQLKKLFDAVHFVLSRNCGKPFSNQMFTQIQEAHDRQKEIGVERYSAEQISYSKKEIGGEYLMQITKMVEEKLNSTIERLEKRLLEEQKARQEAEQKVAEAMLRSEVEILRLGERLEKAQQEIDKAREENEKYREAEKSRREKEEQNKCIIL